MVEFKVKNYDGQIYLKEELKQFLNTPVLTIIPGTEAALIFSEGIPLRRIKESLKAILVDLEHRIGIEDEGEK